VASAVPAHRIARIVRSRVILLATALSVWTALPRADEDGLTGVVSVGGRPRKDVVVWLPAVEGPGAPGRAARVVLDQRNLEFVPHVLAVPVGASVEMPNSDRVFHNVFSFRDGKRFDLGLYPAGTTRVVTFDRPGLSRIFCNIHPNMAAYVLAVDSERVAVTDADGRFSIPGVAPGGYLFHAWRPGGETISGSLTLDASRPVEIALP
jgi:plastocyanin